MIYNLEAAHKASFDNRAALEAEQKCGCFYCKKIFSSCDIEDWIDEGKSGTAQCPYCGIDSVIGESSGFEITEDFLHKMHLRWFESGAGNCVSTTFGGIFLLFDGDIETFRHLSVEPKEPYAEVSGIHKIEFDYNADGKVHEICICLNNPECDALSDTGERFDAVTADIGEGRITLAFIEPENLDLEIEFAQNGIILHTTERTASQTLTFGVCWIDKLPSPDDVQTWLGADVK